ncbi:MAG: hypothetical protein HY883_04780 [Deltaproteobacteria bacterium]|nr:hypothetical protein [Deltaproteobacteria bacterium]
MPDAPALASRRSPLGEAKGSRGSPLGAADGIGTSKICWTDYKTLRQYQSMGDQIERFVNGGEKEGPKQNGYLWLTREP